ncbi:MAG TPA: hypothetical protein VF011_07585 [Terriglobales bacterium]
MRNRNHLGVHVQGSLNAGVSHLTQPELAALLHRRHNAGVWELENGAPNFRILKDADAIKIEIVDKETHAAYVQWAKDKSSGRDRFADLRQWWRENPR